MSFSDCMGPKPREERTRKVRNRTWQLKGFILDGWVEGRCEETSLSWPGLSAALTMCGHRPPLSREEIQHCNSCIVQEDPSWETSIRSLPLPASPGWPAETNTERTQLQLRQQCFLLEFTTSHYNLYKWYKLQKGFQILKWSDIEI